jgi:hypothetical protein
LSNIQHHIIAQISGRIYGVAGYYSENDATQHVVVATHDGTLYEVHWNHSTPYTSPQQFAQFPGIASLGGFFTSDDNRQHVIVATGDGWLNELYFTNLQQQVNTRPLLQLPPSNFHIGMASFCSSDDGMRHATVGGADNILYEVVWSAQHAPTARILADQFRLSDVAAIAGYCDFYEPPHAEHFRSVSVIVAMQGGDVFDVHYGFGGVGTNLLTTFSPPLVNVAALVNTDTHVRQVIVLNATGELNIYPYTFWEAFSQIPLYTLSNVIDMAAYYSAYDRKNHVILATSDGNIHEVYYE